MRETHRNFQLKTKLQRRALGHPREGVLAMNPAQVAINITVLPICLHMAEDQV